MNLKRWSIVILIIGLLLALSPLGAQAEPYPPFKPHPNYHHPHGNAYGWHGPRPHAFDRHQKYFRRSRMGPRNPRPYVHQVYTGPPSVAYVRPVTPIIGFQTYPQPQPVFSPLAPPGLHGQITF
jgi:hypothetical protein